MTAQWDVVVVGAGAAGLVAAIGAAERGRRTLLLEKNRKPGAKILMSGGTRCNLTHATDRRGIIEAFGSAGRFLHSALSAFGPREVIELFENEGVATKVEQPLGKVFPASDRALDVLEALLRRLARSDCTLSREEPLETIERSPEGFRLTTSRRVLTAEKVVLAPGGASYPGCGTAGDGYRWAAALGHAIVAPLPALVPLRSDAPWVHALRGVTIADVLVRVVSGEAAAAARPKREVLAECRGALLFTHFGLSGPAPLDVSRAVSGRDRPDWLALVCDFVPEIPPEALAANLADLCDRNGKQQAATVLASWLPQRLAETIAAQAGVPSRRRAAEISKADRGRLVQGLKRLPIPIAGTLGFKKAEVTAGGVSLDEVDSRTLQSKLVPGLFIAGELLDLDGPIGGYNFQAAFSTGWLAGQSA